jgi:hypothetical protein
MNNQSGTHLTFTTKVHFRAGEKGRLQMRRGQTPVPAPVPAGRVPKLSRLMALAIRLGDLLAGAQVRDYAELARLGHVSRARVTQIMNLLNLAPDLQEQILFLPETAGGHDPIKEWQVRPIAAQPAWGKQRRLWKALLREMLQDRPAPTA